MNSPLSLTSAEYLCVSHSIPSHAWILCLIDTRASPELPDPFTLFIVTRNCIHPCVQVVLLKFGQGVLSLCWGHGDIFLYFFSCCFECISFCILYIYGDSHWDSVFMFFPVFCLCARDWTQGLPHAKHVLYPRTLHFPGFVCILSESSLPFLHVMSHFFQHYQLNFFLSLTCTVPLVVCYFCVKVPDIKLNLISQQY